MCGAFSGSSPEQHVNFSISVGIQQPKPELIREEDAHALDNFCNRAIAVASGLGVPRGWKLDSPVAGSSGGHPGHPVDHRTQSSCLAGENNFWPGNCGGHKGPNLCLQALHFAFESGEFLVNFRQRLL
jgi:hypothetical protein